MFPGMQHYQEGSYKPERGSAYSWHVWCGTGALQVLAMREYVDLLNQNPAKAYLINFANGSAASIQPGHPLWQALAEIAKTYTIEVFPLILSGRYVSWTGVDSDLRRFDAIKISTQKAS